jgi:hypothetical protein
LSDRLTAGKLKTDEHLVGLARDPILDGERAEAGDTDREQDDENQ